MAGGVTRQLESVLPPRLFIPLADPSLNARMDLVGLKVAMDRVAPLEATTKLKIEAVTRCLLIAAVLCLLWAKTLMPNALSIIPGPIVIALLLAAIWAAHGRYAEFWNASLELWHNTLFYILFAALAIAVLLVPAGHMTTWLLTFFGTVLLVPPMIRGLRCIQNPKSAAMIRQIARYEKTLSREEKAVLQLRLRTASEVL